MYIKTPENAFRHTLPSTSKVVHRDLKNKDAQPAHVARVYFLSSEAIAESFRHSVIPTVLKTSKIILKKSNTLNYNRKKHFFLL